MLSAYTWTTSPLSINLQPYLEKESFLSFVIMDRLACKKMTSPKKTAHLRKTQYVSVLVLSLK